MQGQFQLCRTTHSISKKPSQCEDCISKFSVALPYFAHKKNKNKWKDEKNKNGKEKR